MDVSGHYREGEFGRALRVAEGMTSHCIVPATLGKLRMTRKGSRELRKLLGATPGISRKHVRSVFSLRNFDNAAIDHFMKHLECSGLNDIISAE